MLLFNSPLHSLRKTNFFRLLLKSNLNQPKFCNLGFKHKVALRPLTHASIRWRRKTTESNIRKILQSVVHLLDKKKDEGCFLDVGANIGIYTWEVRNYSPNRKIIAFEPDPNNFDLLQMTLQHSDLKNINILPLGLSSVSIKATFLQDDLTSATGTLETENKPWVEQYLNGSAKKIFVNTTTIDEVITNPPTPSFVKIDVEGHELEVLQGAKKILNQEKPVLLVESFPPKQKKVIRYLQNIDYQIFDADRTSPVSEKTHNLFAWHPSGPLDSKDINKVLTA